MKKLFFAILFLLQYSVSIAQSPALKIVLDEGDTIEVVRGSNNMYVTEYGYGVDRSMSSQHPTTLTLYCTCDGKSTYVELFATTFIVEREYESHNGTHMIYSWFFPVKEEQMKKIKSCDLHDARLHDGFKSVFQIGVLNTKSGVFKVKF